DRLLDVRALADVDAHALPLARQLDGVDLHNLNAEDLFHSLLDLDLAGIGSDLEGVLVVLGAHHGTLGDDRLLDNIVSELHYAYTSCSFSTAALSMINLSALRISYTLRVDAIVVRTP